MRETERRAREAEGQPEPEPRRFKRDLHPDLAEALAAAEDALTAASAGPEVRLRGDGCRVELTSTRRLTLSPWPSGSSHAGT